VNPTSTTREEVRMRARWAGVGFAAATTLLVVAGPAAADAPEGNARFTVAGAAELLGFFDVGDDLVTGFTNVANVGGVDGRPANFRPCGVLDALTS
jgi:hypothetical protein